jgi:hypothetical protein
VVAWFVKLLKIYSFKIQDGAVGEGSIRFKNLDEKRFSICEFCFKLRKTVKEIIKDDTKAVEEFLEFDEYLFYPFFVPENDLDVFYRFPVTNAKDLSHSLHAALKIYSNRPCFGIKKNNMFQWINYETVMVESIKLACGISEFINPGTFVGICSQNRVEFMYIDFACTFNHTPTVGIHPSWKDYDIKFVINNTKMECIVCESNVAYRFLNLLEDCPSLKYLVIMDQHDVKSDHLKIFDYDSLLISSKTHSGIHLESSVESTKPEEDWIFSVIYSSGTSGDPKGIIANANGWREDNLVQPKWIYPYAILSLTSLAHVIKNHFYLKGNG